MFVLYILRVVTPSTPEFIFPQSPGLLFGVHVVFINCVLKGKIDALLVSL